MTATRVTEINRRKLYATRDFKNMNADQLGRLYRTQGEKLSYAERDQLVTAIANRAGKDREIFAGLVQKKAPKSYLTLREAEEELAQGMWGCVPCPANIDPIKRIAGRSLASSPRLAQTAARLRTAFRAGKLTLYLTIDETRSCRLFTPVPDWAKSPIPVSKALVGRVLVEGNRRMRRMPATFAIRPSRKAGGDDRLLALWNSGCALLVVRQAEFRRWYRTERGKRKWPSQRTQRHVRQGLGRPRKQEGRLKSLILGNARGGSWDGRRQPLTALHRILAENEAPSVDTIGRLVDELLAETGEPALRRRYRIRRK